MYENASFYVHSSYEFYALSIKCKYQVTVNVIYIWRNVWIEGYFFHTSNNAIIYMFFTLICIYHSIPISFSDFFFQISLGTSFTIYIFLFIIISLSLFRSKLRPLLVVFSWLGDTKISFDWTCAWKERANIFEVKLFVQNSFPLPHTHIYNAASSSPQKDSGYKGVAKTRNEKKWRKTLVILYFRVCVLLECAENIHGRFVHQ